MIIEQIINIFKKIFRQINLTDRYKMLIEQIEDDFKRIVREIGFEEIVDKIKPKYIVKANPKLAGKSYPIFKIICIGKEHLDKYLKFSNYQIELYHILFHELIHYSREQKNKYHLNHLTKFIISLELLIAFVLLARLSLYLLSIDILLAIMIIYKLFIIKYNRTEEIVTEAITAVFLSKVFGKERIENILKKEIGSGWGNAIPRYSDGKHVYYLYFKDRKYLEYDLGKVLGYLLLNVNADKQREYTKRLLETYTKKDLKKLIYDLRVDLPNNIKILGYYNILKKVIDGKAKIEFIYR